MSNPATSGFKPSLTSLNQLIQKTRRRRETRDKVVGGLEVSERLEEGAMVSLTSKEGLEEEEEETGSITPASYSLRADSIDVHFLYVSLIFIQAYSMLATCTI